MTTLEGGVGNEVSDINFNIFDTNSYIILVDIKIELLESLLKQHDLDEVIFINQDTPQLYLEIIDTINIESMRFKNKRFSINEELPITNVDIDRLTQSARCTVYNFILHNKEAYLQIVNLIRVINIIATFSLTIDPSDLNNWSKSESTNTDDLNGKEYHFSFDNVTFCLKSTSYVLESNETLINYLINFYYTLILEKCK